MSLITEAQAIATSEALNRFLNAEPTMQTLPDGRIRIYYKGQELAIARKNFANMMDGAPGPIQYDLMDVVQPWALKKYGGYVLGAALLVFLLGKI